MQQLEEKLLVPLHQTTAVEARKNCGGHLGDRRVDDSWPEAISSCQTACQQLRAIPQSVEELGIEDLLIVETLVRILKMEK